MKTKMLHTPGPWEVGYGKEGKGYLGVFPVGSFMPICMMKPDGHYNDADLPNARLAAAAPDLLEAVLAVQKEMIGHSARALVDLALRKVRGEA